MTDVSKFIEENKRITNSPAHYSDKYLLTINEASIYFNIGKNKLRRLVPENLGTFGVIRGNRYLIIREKFEEFIQESAVI